MAWREHLAWYECITARAGQIHTLQNVGIKTDSTFSVCMLTPLTYRTKLEAGIG